MAEKRPNKDPQKAKPDNEDKVGKLGRGKRTEAVRALIAIVEKKIKDGEMKPTLGDYIKLVQMQKDIEEEQPRDIQVTWVDPKEGSSE